MYVRKQLLRLFVDLILLRSFVASASDSEPSTNRTTTAGDFTELTNNHLILLRSFFASSSDSEPSANATRTAGAFTVLTDNGTTPVLREHWTSTSSEQWSALHSTDYQTAPPFINTFTNGSEFIASDQQIIDSVNVTHDVSTDAHSATAAMGNASIKTMYYVSTDAKRGESTLASNMTIFFLENTMTVGASKDDVVLESTDVLNLTVPFSKSPTRVIPTILVSTKSTIMSTSAAQSTASGVSTAFSTAAAPSSTSGVSTALSSAAAPSSTSGVSTALSTANAPSSASFGAMSAKTSLLFLPSSTVASNVLSQVINSSSGTSGPVSIAGMTAATTATIQSSATLLSLSTTSATDEADALPATTKILATTTVGTLGLVGVSSMQTSSGDVLKSAPISTDTHVPAQPTFISTSTVPTTVREPFTATIPIAETVDYSLSSSSTDWDTSLTWTEETQSTTDFARYEETQSMTGFSRYWQNYDGDWLLKYDDMHSDYFSGSTAVDGFSGTTATESTDDHSDDLVSSKEAPQHNGWFTGEIESGTLEDDFIEYKNSSEDETTAVHDMHFSEVGSAVYNTDSFRLHSKLNQEKEVDATQPQPRSSPLTPSTNRVVASTNRITSWSSVQPPVFQNFAGSLKLMATYTKDLSDTSSAAFRSYATVICDSVRKPSDALMLIRSCVVYSIRPGSVIVDFTLVIELANASANSSANVTRTVQNMIVTRVAQAAPSSWNVSAASLTLAAVAAPTSSAASTVSQQSAKTGLTATTRMQTSTISTRTTLAFKPQSADNFLPTEAMSMPFTPAAPDPPAERLGDLDSSVAWWVWLVVAVGVLVMGTVGACVYNRKRRQHQAVPSPPNASAAEKGAAGEGTGAIQAKAKHDPDPRGASAPTAAGAPTLLPQMRFDTEKSESPGHEDKGQQCKQEQQQEQQQQQQQTSLPGAPNNTQLPLGQLKPVPVIEIKAPDDSPVVDEGIKTPSVLESGDASSTASTRTAVPQPDAPLSTQTAGTSSALPPTEHADNTEQFDDASDVFTQPSLKPLNTTSNEKTAKDSASEAPSSSTASLKTTAVEAGERVAQPAGGATPSPTSSDALLALANVPSGLPAGIPEGGRAGNAEDSTKETVPEADADNNEKFEDA